MKNMSIKDQIYKSLVTKVCVTTTVCALLCFRAVAADDKPSPAAEPTPIRFIELKGHTNVVWSAAFSTDGTQIVTAASDKTARVFDSKTGANLLTLEGHSRGLLSAAFSTDGTRIVTASSDKTARVYDAKTGANLLTLEGHSGSLNSAAFSPDGTQIVTASYLTAHIWQLPYKYDFSLKKILPSLVSLLEENQWNESSNIFLTELVKIARQIGVGATENVAGSQTAAQNNYAALILTLMTYLDDPALRYHSDEYSGLFKAHLQPAIAKADLALQKETGIKDLSDLPISMPVINTLLACLRASMLSLQHVGGFTADAQNELNHILEIIGDTQGYFVDLNESQQQFLREPLSDFLRPLNYIPAHRTIMDHLTTNNDDPRSTCARIYAMLMKYLTGV